MFLTRRSNRILTVISVCVSCAIAVSASAQSSSALSGRPSSPSPTTFVDVIPNLVVSDVGRSMAFYRDVLGFTVTQTVPDKAPFVFAWMQRGPVVIFLNDQTVAKKDMPAVGNRPLGGSLTIYISVKGIDALHTSIGTRAVIVMPLTTMPYGMREFAVKDPDGYVVQFAEDVSGK